MIHQHELFADASSEAAALPAIEGMTYVPDFLTPSEQEAIRGVWHEVRDIWHFVFRDRVVALAMVQWTIGAILGLVVATLVPGFAQRMLHVRVEDAVFVMAPAGIGMVAGTALLNRWGDRFEKHFLTNIGLFTVAACLALTGGLALVTELLTSGNPPLITMPTLGEVSILVPPIMCLALVAWAAVGRDCVT